MSPVKWKMVTINAMSTTNIRERERLGIAIRGRNWTIIDVGGMRVLYWRVMGQISLWRTTGTRWEMGEGVYRSSSTSERYVAILMVFELAVGRIDVRWDIKTDSLSKHGDWHVNAAFLLDAPPRHTCSPTLEETLEQNGRELRCRILVKIRRRMRFISLSLQITLRGRLTCKCVIRQCARYDYISEALLVDVLFYRGRRADGALALRRKSCTNMNVVNADREYLQRKSSSERPGEEGGLRFAHQVIA